MTGCGEATTLSKLPQRVEVLVTGIIMVIVTEIENLLGREGLGRGGD